MKKAAANRVQVSHLHRYLRFSPDETIRLVRRVLHGEHAFGWTIGVVFVPDTVIRGLNARYRARRRTTDVLAFIYDDSTGREGDIIVCLDQARRQAPTYNASYSEEVARLIIHGTLHLLGFDDTRPKARASMVRREEFYFGKFYARTRR